jgi:hypothetical protein
MSCRRGSSVQVSNRSEQCRIDAGASAGGQGISAGHYLPRDHAEMPLLVC